MKLLRDLIEMTHRMGTQISVNPVLDTSHHSMGAPQYVGKMQHGYSVYAQARGNVTFYVFKNNDETVGYCQTLPTHIPKHGNCVELLYIHVYPKHQSHKLSLQFILFFGMQLGITLLLNKQHFIDTELGIMKYIMSQPFDSVMVNTVTGDEVAGTMDNYYTHSSTSRPTDWAVLIKGHSSIGEGGDLSWGGEEFRGRYLWSLGDFFEDITT